MATQIDTYQDCAIFWDLSTDPWSYYSSCTGRRTSLDQVYMDINNLHNPDPTPDPTPEPPVDGNGAAALGGIGLLVLLYLIFTEMG